MDLGFGDELYSIDDSSNTMDLCQIQEQPTSNKFMAIENMASSSSINMEE
jgi:hypothetical protein